MFVYSCKVWVSALSPLLCQYLHAPPLREKQWTLHKRGTARLVVVGRLVYIVFAYSRLVRPRAS